ncbi:hypothetical protein Golax_018344 [Gossypium laxum]|uniref:Retrotransposon gag domain-containing protein n=1 Tax=Gossypium laxum TaxID=34288 RepID=A0A7J8Z4P4_9ROSI|nr:hypothetical protein [Gossypium laxum]
MGDVKETLEVMERRTNELDSMKEQLKEYMVEAFSSNMDPLQALLNTVVGKLIEKNETLKAMMIVIKAKNKATVTFLNTKIEELEESSLYANLLWERDVREGNGQLWRWSNTSVLWALRMILFYCGDVIAKLRWFSQQDTVREYVKAFSVLMLQLTNLSNNETLFFFIDLSNNKARFLQEFQRRKVDELTKTKTIVESLLELGLHKVWGCLKRSFFSVNGDDEPEKAPLNFGSVLSGVKVKKGHKRKEPIQKLGPKVEKESSWIRMMSSKSVPTMGVAKGVELQLDSWNDMRPVELLKKLPPNKEVDHKTELMPNTERLARALYQCLRQN